jgi:hypothetical protein
VVDQSGVAVDARTLITVLDDILDASNITAIKSSVDGNGTVRL